MLCMCCGSPAERKHSTKSAPKSTKNVSGGTREQPRAPTKQQVDVFLDLFAKTDANIPMIFINFGSNICEKCDQKHGQKTAPIQNYFFFGGFGVFQVSRARFLSIWVPKMAPRRVPERLFRELLPRVVFSLNFRLLFGKKCKKSKNEKVRFDMQITHYP